VGGRRKKKASVPLYSVPLYSATETGARRLVDPDDASKTEYLENGLTTLGVGLVVEDVAGFIFGGIEPER